MNGSAGARHPKRGRLAVCLSAAGLAAALAALPLPSPRRGPAPDGAISGRVTDISEAGIPNVDVVIYDLQQRFIKDQYTDASGNYSIGALAAGSYVLYFSTSAESNYVSQYYDNKPDFATGDPVVVTEGQTTSGINARMVKAGTVTGRVTDMAGHPIGSSNVIIIIYGLNNVTVRSVWPDAGGNFTATGVPPGSYRVLFDTWPGDNYYIEQWYNEKGAIGTADPVLVVSDRTTSNINARLVIGGIITGHVTDWKGAPVFLANIQVDSVTDGTSIVRSAWTDVSGNYRVQGLWTGSYKVFFLPSTDANLAPEWYNDKETFGTADAVAVVQEHTTPGINAQLDPGGTVSGRATAPGGAGVPNVNVRVYDLSQTEVRSRLTEADGTYSIVGLRTGAYHVYFDTLPAANFISEWYNDRATPAAADLVTIAAGAETANINAQLALGGMISGRVTDPSSAGIAGVDVQVYDPSQVLVRSQATGADGTYAVQGLPTGVYRVYFSTSAAGNYFAEWYSDKASFAAADAVPVTAGETTSGVDAQLARGGTITGFVRNAQGEGVRNIWVRIRDLADAPIRNVQTNSAGQYFALGLATGSYKVLFDPSPLDNFFPQYYNGKATFASADVVPVTIGQTTSGISASLVGGGILGGRVTNESGAAISSVKAVLYDLSGTKLAEALTDLNGYYSHQKLASGSYKIEFDASAAGNYFSEFYNDKATLADADAVPVTAGEMTANIDAQLAARPVIISGTLTLAHIPSSGTSGVAVNASVGITGQDGTVGSIGFDLVYDTAMFTYKGVALGTATASWTALSGAEVSPGRIRVTAGAGTGVPIPVGTAGSLVLVRFRVKCVAFSNGTTATTTAEAYASDLVHFTPSPRTATFTYLACPALGDVNGDGRKTPGDAQRAFDIYMGRTTPSACQSASADANCDGAVTPADAQAIFDDYTGQTALPTCCADSPAPSPAATPAGKAAPSKALIIKKSPAVRPDGPAPPAGRKRGTR